MTCGAGLAPTGGGKLYQYHDHVCARPGPPCPAGVPHLCVCGQEWGVRGPGLATVVAGTVWMHQCGTCAGAPTEHDTQAGRDDWVRGHVHAVGHRVRVWTDACLQPARPVGALPDGRRDG